MENNRKPVWWQSKTFKIILLFIMVALFVTIILVLTHRRPAAENSAVENTEPTPAIMEVSEITELVKEPTGIVYLTFDDGPGPYTADLLDVLAKYNVKATFFVTCAGDDALILREYEEGHAVALHTCSHNYATIYTSVSAFMADLTTVQDRVERITGYKSYLMRFAGGSSNLVSTRYDGGARIMSQLVNEVERRGFTYFDWNLSSGDAGGITTADGVYNIVANGLKVGGSSVVLQHDIKSYSVAAVERIIQNALERGFVFDKLSADSFTAHHGVNN